MLIYSRLRFLFKNKVLSLQQKSIEETTIMKKTLFLLTTAMIYALMAGAQVNTTEPADPNPGDSSCWTTLTAMKAGWGTIDERYSKSAIPTFAKAPVLHGWRGERLNAQALIVTPSEVVSASLTASDLKSGRKVIPATAIKPYFVRYVIGDTYQDHTATTYYPDRLGNSATLAIEANTTRPVWIEVSIPRDAAAGTYKGTLTINCDGTTFKLPYTVEVVNRTLPEPKEWAFHLDLWQNPYAVARYYEVPLWSKEHFDLMRPLMTELANAGQKVITTSIIRHPWNSQTYDPFESMIGKYKALDGSWSYDYTVFDQWVEFMMSCGIDEQIDCYTLVPWGYKFDYYDVASHSIKEIACEPGTPAYEDLIFPFLKDFAAHLKAKGWFARTCIAMDERPMKQLQAAREVVRRADPGYRLKGAVNYSPEVVDLMYDISITFRHGELPEGVVEDRQANNQLTTFYTCCNPERPNTFTFSPLPESAFLGWHAAAIGVDGYLRWAYCSWPPQPCQDTRYGKGWSSGDTFLHYPGQPSIRWQRLVEGIQQYEKIRLLRPSLTKKQSALLDKALAPMGKTSYDADTDFAALIATARQTLRSIE